MPTSEAFQDQIRALSRELESANRQLATVAAQRLEAAQELQLVIEQIETSREQVTSAGREMLLTRNEIAATRGELHQVQVDLAGLLSCIDITIVLVGRDRRIRGFTEGASRMLNLHVQDIGKPLEQAIDIPNLDRLVADKIHRSESHESEILNSDGRTFLLRLQLYYADNTVEGVVLTLTSPTQEKSADPEFVW